MHGRTQHQEGQPQRSSNKGTASDSSSTFPHSNSSHLCVEGQVCVVGKEQVAARGSRVEGITQVRQQPVETHKQRRKASSCMSSATHTRSSSFVGAQPTHGLAADRGDRAHVLTVK